MSSIAMGIDASGRLYKQKIDELKDYMKWKDLSPTTQRKVIKYYEVKYRGKFFEEQTLLHEMNDSLRMEIAAHNCRSLITKVPFLNRKMKDGRDDVFIGKVAMALSAFYFVPGDIVLSTGSTEPEMFFISSGSVDIYLNGKKISNLTAGHYFGELCLLSENPHCSTTVQAISSSVIYRLHRAELIPILHEFEDMRIKIASHCVQDEYNIE
ncbi:camp-binding domain-like protein [Rhizoclosmatium globosum]|uniref:Camp-binding domain-like protein n=1 Tax=Rhizoclosmatium globosum TaxID=329046 RepID=A0A1Y2BXG3_9FUNG|nr:camp-binding domain-like protein [Rhizoclosmatium globosum]|eukprot:ORY39436.1 camp-binding domain-like protein [Rhizoclosmatium globosum]